jgi:hypothetical protein
MVHALHEIRRVLNPGDILIDLRPLLDRWPVELVWSSGQRQVGRAIDLPEALGDDEAANEAMDGIVGSGLFAREQQDAFPIFYYWDTPSEMESYIAENWSDVISAEDEMWGALKSAWASANADARVRMRMKLLITRYVRSA